MVREYKIDFHVHTCLSPCGELEMSPRAIVRTALERGLDGLAVCDHNSAENVPAVLRAAEGTGLTVLAGLEVSSKEEVHVLALFESLRDARRLEETVYLNLDGRNDPEAFGWQVVVNAAGEVTGFNPKLLIGASNLALEELVGAIHASGGLAVAAHIDRDSFSLISQLGFIPPELAIDAIELSRTADDAGDGRWNGIAGEYPVVAGSDAHRLADIAAIFSTLRLERLNLAAIKPALRAGIDRRFARRGEGEGARRSGGRNN